VLEHPGYAPAPDAATFTVTAPLDAPVAATDIFQTYVVGAWLQRGFSAVEVAPAATAIALTYGFTAANSVSGHAKPDQVTAQDAFLILRYGPNGLTGVAEPKAPVVQTGAATAVDMNTMVPVVQDQMLAFTITPSSFTNRYRAVQHFDAVTAGVTWTLVAAPGSLVAAPGDRTAINAGPLLRNGLLTTEVGVNTSFGNPFAARGWNAMFVLNTSASRPYTAPATTAAVSLFAGMDQYVPPSAAVPPIELATPAGLPIVVVLDGLPISTDGQAIKPPGGFVHVTFLTDRQGATLYNLQVWDLAPNPTVATVLDRKLVFAAASDQASFMVPPEVFKMGHSYTLRALTTLGGFPAAGAGDFVTRELPLAQSYLDSPVITVMP
jgi:hypothetical protein